MWRSNRGLHLMLFVMRNLTYDSQIVNSKESLHV